MSIQYYSRTEIAGIRRAGQVVMAILEELRQAVRPGITTAALDALAVRELKRHGATSNFKGYTPIQGIKPFPGVICASVDEAIVHGIPGRYALREGDILSIDFGAVVDGWHGDSAITVPVGAISAEAQRLLDVTQEALDRGIAAARGGNRVMDISRAIQTYVEGEGFSLIRQLYRPWHWPRIARRSDRAQLCRSENRQPVAAAGHGDVHRADGERRQARHARAIRPLDGRDRRRQPGGALRAYRRHYGRRPRGVDGACGSLPQRVSG